MSCAEMLSEIRAGVGKFVAIRRDLHMHPEKGFDLPRTSALVKRELESYGLEVQTGFVQSAVLGILRTGRPGKTVALRADMDALGMQDLKDVPYKSQNPGVCHACGHDSHTVVMLGTAKYLADHRDELKGTIKFVFQPAEEGPAPGGAKLIMDSGVLDDVDVIIGAHTQPRYPAGTVIYRYNEMYGSGDFFEVHLKGVGGHAAAPQNAHDVITTAAQIINAYQCVKARECAPLKSSVVSICSVNAGVLATKNVLPDELTFGGTFRTHDDATRSYLSKRLEDVAKTISTLNGVQCDFKLEPLFPPFGNDNEVTDVIRAAATDVLGAEHVVEMTEPFMGSEDFAHYTKKIKAAFFLFGVGNEAKGITAYYHNPKFDVDEDAIAPTIAVMAETAKRLLGC